jgi:hypothetical protein
MIWILLILGILAGILIGYGGHTSIWRFKNRIKGKLYCFYHYKVLKEPEPDISEVLANVIPGTIAAVIGLKLSSDVAKAYEKAIIKAKTRR